MKITRCQVNHLINPLGYELGKPVFSYVVEEVKGKIQTDARICVSRSAAMESQVFDTGFINIDSLAYKADMLLLPRTRYYWTVTVHTDAGEEVTSEVNWFETAKQDETWAGKWITCDSKEPRHPIFTKELPITKEVAAARLYICGLGLYEAYLNSEKIGTEYMTPYANNYNRWLQYQTYDITDQLAKGGRLAVLLGNGWYRGRFGFNMESNGKPFYSDTLKLIAEVRVLYADGSEDIFGTDESWEVTRSQITFSNIYDGEAADATLPETDAIPAQLCEEVLAPLAARYSTPVTVHEELSASRFIHTPAGETVLDIGQNLAGTFRLKVHEPKGTVIHLQFGEILQGGNFYRDNLRTAKAEYIWVSDGEAHTLQPHFTFFGYRYVKIEGIENLKKEDYTALSLYSNIPPAGTLTTGNEKVNQLISNTQWGQKGNFLDIPTDCPQRDERMGWTGDAQVFCPTAAYLTDCCAFFRKYLHDMAEEQLENSGMVPNVVPSVGDNDCSSAWGDATCIIPWNLYLFYGDKSILSEHFDSMKAWVDFMQIQDGDDHAWRKHRHYGDWLALDHPSGGKNEARGGTDEGFLADVHYRHSAMLTAKAARELGKEDEANHYDALAGRILKGIREEYFSPSGRCCIDTQTAHLITLRYGLHEHDRAREALQKSLFNAGNKLRTGFIGTPILCDVLSEEGLHELAYDLLLGEEYPGWLYAVNLGATTIWERWNSVEADGSISSTGMNSLNHYAYGSIVAWMWRYIAGIQPCEEAPGFRKVKLVPVPDWRLRHAAAEYASPAGTYKSAWKALDTTHVEMSFTVPFGCTAELELPFAPEQVYEDKANPMFVRVEKGICHLMAGTYLVRYETTKPLRKVYSTHIPIYVLMNVPKVRAVLEKEVPQFARTPSSMWRQSMRQIAAQYSAQAADTDKHFAMIDAMLAQIDEA